MKHGVHHDGTMLRSRKQRRTLGDERQHRQAQVAVQRQRHLRRAESGLGRRVGTSGPRARSRGCPGNSTTRASDLRPKSAPPSLYYPYYFGLRKFQTYTKVQESINEPSLSRLDCSAGVPMTHLNRGGWEGGQAWGTSPALPSHWGLSFLSQLQTETSFLLLLLATSGVLLAWFHGWHLHRPRLPLGT